MSLRKMYESPELEVVVLEAKDILTNSSDDDGNMGEWDEV